jgi:hypothetical protein
MAEIQKPADQAEQKPDATVKKSDNLGKDRAVTSDQVTEADAQRTSKFSTFGDMKAYADSEPLLIDMGDGTEVSSKGTQVAWDPRTWATEKAKEVDKQTKAVTHRIDKATALTAAVKNNPDLQYTEGKEIFPHRGREDDFVSYGACAAASKPFENVRLKIGAGPGHIDPDLIAAIMRNEQFFYKNLVDTGTDNYVRKHGNLDVLHDDTYSIGPAQMQIRNIQNLVKQFPEQLAPYANDPLRAALNPGDAPMFVAAYMSNMVEHLEKQSNPGFSSGVWQNIQKHWKDGDANGALILAFNPDPVQIQNVGRQLTIIKQQKNANGKLD